MPLIFRVVKGTPLTFLEGDDNLRYLEGLIISSSADFSNWTGSTSSQFAGTASLAITASYALNAGTTVDTGSLVSTASFNTFTSSYYNDSSSFDQRISSISFDSSSLATTESLNLFTSSYYQDSASFDQRINSISFDSSSLLTTESFNNFTSSYNTGSFSGSFTGQLIGTASWANNATNALTANFVNLIQGPGIIINGLEITSSVRTVNSIFPTDGNIPISLSATITGTSASLASSGSGNITGSIPDGLVWIISNDPTPSNNGDVYIYSSGSVGAWYQVAPLDQAASDARYIKLDGANTPMTGDLNMGGNNINNVGTMNGTASFATSASWAPPTIIDTGSLLLTSSFNDFTSSYFQDSASFDQRINGISFDSSSLVTTESFNNFTASYNTGSFTGSFTGELIGTASWANNATTASYVLNAITASHLIGYPQDSASFDQRINNISFDTSSLPTPAITVNAATTAALPRTPVYDNGLSGVGAFISASTNGTLGAIDGITLVDGDRILVKNQAAQLQNGIYEIITTGSASARYIMSRSLDSDETSELDSQIVIPSFGSTNAGGIFAQNTNNPIVGTSNIIYQRQTSTLVSQNTAGTQAIYQIPWWTGTGRDLSRGSNHFRYINVTSGTTVTTSSLQLTGSFNLSGSAFVRGLTSASQTDVLTYNSSTGQIFFTASSAIGGTTVNTGSLLTTASVNLNTITFTKGDGSTFPITVDTGSGGGGGGGTPGGSDTQIQFNSGSTFSGSVAFRFIYASQSLEQGLNLVTSASYAHNQGFGNKILSDAVASHAEGGDTLTLGNYSHAEGNSTRAIGGYSHAEGSNTITAYRSGFIDSFMVGNNITFTYPGDYSQYFPSGSQIVVLADGFEYMFTDFINVAPVYDGTYTTLTFLNSSDVYVGYVALTAYSPGYYRGTYAHAEGNFTIAAGDYSHAEGNNTQAIGNSSHAEGSNTQAIGLYSHAEGDTTQAIGYASHAEGYQTKTGTQNAYSASVINGIVTMSADYGNNPLAYPLFTPDSILLLYNAPFYTSYAVSQSYYDGGLGSTIVELYDTSVNASNVSILDASSTYGASSQGGDQTIPGVYAHAEGIETAAIGPRSHAEGQGAQTIGSDSHAEGDNTRTIGFASHAEGKNTISIGAWSHTEGRETQAIGESSHAAGLSTVASGSYQSVIGQFNISSSAQSAFIIGNGADSNNRSNLLFAQGSQVQITGSLNVSGSGTFTQFVTASAALFSGSGTQRLRVIGSGSADPLFQVIGSQGELFTITDSLSGSLFSVNDISGLPVIEAFSDNTVLIGSYQAPSLNTTVLLSSTTAGVNTIYTVPTASYDAVYIDYVIRSGSIGRAGTFTAMWSGSSTSISDISVTPFGNTSGFTFGANISGSNLLISGSCTTAGWRVKTIIRSI